MTRYVMVADLERCVGCQTCTAACRHANATSPAVQWRKVLDLEAGSYPNVSRVFVPVGCQHCADPPCMHVCPTTATRQRADGIVTIDYDLCIGCAYCDVACPYQARFKIGEARYAYGSPMQSEAVREDPRRIGVAQKCTFCSDRIDFGLANGLTPGLDPSATPACVNSCIADALQFGDVDDAQSNVSRLLREQQHFRMHEEIGTEPGFYYLYDKRHAKLAPQQEISPLNAEVGQVRSRGVEPWHQQHWDWKAAANFLCGGAGSGLFVFAAMAGAAGAPFAAAGLVSIGLVALGLLILLFKIGRPLRFAYVLLQPGRSWMTREAWIVAVFLPLALLSIWTNSIAVAAIAAVLALLFLYAQSMIIKEAKGIPAWRSWWTPPLIVVAGLTEGAALFVVGAVSIPGLAWAARVGVIALTALIIVRSLVWRSYLANLESEGAPVRALETLGRYRPWFFALGLAAPIALICLAFLIPSAASPLFILASLAAFASGWAMKFIIVTRAGFNQGYAIQRTPTGGSAKGVLVKPGWVLPQSG